ncbi:MAG: heme-binding protein [Candidatus Humimicrobiaceae bacterium]
MRNVKTLDLADAKKAISAMEKKANSMSINLCFCIVDAINNVIILEQMDDSKVHSINLSRAKAITSVSLKDSTENAGKLIKELGIETSYWAGGCETGFKGGIPVYENKEATAPMGAIGVSGGTEDQDQEIALLGLKAMGYITK